MIDYDNINTIAPQLTRHDKQILKVLDENYPTPITAREISTCVFKSTTKQIHNEIRIRLSEFITIVEQEIFVESDGFQRRRNLKYTLKPNYRRTE